MEAIFIVPGEPVGKARARTVRKDGITMTFTPEKTILYENLVKIEYKSQCREIFFGKDVPVEMIVRAYYSIPKSASKKKRAQMLRGDIRPLKKPDSSNVLKSIEDAINLIAYHDDAQIVETHVSRYYSETPRVEVTIRDIPEGGKACTKTS